MTLKTTEEILKETLKSFAPNSYLELNKFIISHPDTDAITFNQLKQALLQHSEEVLKEIEKLKEEINNVEDVEQRVITKSYAFLLINKFKQSIIGKEKNETNKNNR